MRIGVDIGGTFTDFVIFDEESGELTREKQFSTPEDPAAAVVDFLARMEDRPTSVVHGSTVATNAVLERKGARTALVTTRGFRDILAIGRQTRTRIYDLSATRPEPLIPRESCREITERVGSDGSRLVPIEEAEIGALAEGLVAAGVESVAVSFLFSFLRPEHEARVAAALREAGLFVSASSEVLREFREYERTSTTAINAYVGPVVDRYVARLEGALGSAGLRIMQSNGGSMRAGAAREAAVRTILSGPAGGVAGALRVATAAGFDRCISFDMGGTSTDVSLAEGDLRVTTESKVDGLPIAVPAVDIHTVGSGGGSVARVDPGGALRVGPLSAGAVPGPVCYGRGGTRATVTDANLVLGRLAADHFLGGELVLDVEAARDSLERLGAVAPAGSESGLDAAQAAALGVVRVVTAAMERALRRISLERGRDPHDFVLVSFGGAGGLHSCDLARGLGIGTVLVPAGASTLSAFGMLFADVVRDYSQTVMLPGETPLAELERLLAPLLARGREEIAAEGVRAEEITLHPSLDMRYVGQGFELTIPFTADFVTAFHGSHETVYGHSEPAEPTEVVSVRVRAVGSVGNPPAPEEPAAPPGSEPTVDSLRSVVVSGPDFAGAVIEQVPFYAGGQLAPGHRLVGPAVILESDTTVYIGRGDHLTVDGMRNLVIRLDGHHG